MAPISIRYSATTIAGFLGVALIALIARESIDASLTWAIIFISIAIPSLLAAILLDEFKNSGFKYNDKIRIIALRVGYLSSYAAITSILVHFTVWAALLFSISIIVWEHVMDRYVSNSANEDRGQE